MKIGIIGGGWVGCHLSYKLKGDHNITLFDKNDELFLETSYNNQNRLHIGFHYPRSYKTRDLCKSTFYRFINDYNFLVKDVNPNLYCVSSNDSIIDFNTYIKIFDTYNYKLLDHEKLGLKNIDGCIITNEKHINFKDANIFFNKELKNIHVKRKVNNNDLSNLKSEYDLVINATNNYLNNNSDNNFYELTLTLIYKKIKETKFESLTIMDGKFLSIYPYIDDLYTLTDVEHTPIKTFSDIKDLDVIMNGLNSDYFKYKKHIFESKVKTFFPEFNQHYEYNKYFLSIKSKFKSSLDSRHPIITREDNIINCFTGKIQGIYTIEDYIKNIINENSSIF